MEALSSPEVINPIFSRTPRKTTALLPTTAQISVMSSSETEGLLSDQRSRPKVKIAVGQGATPKTGEDGNR